MKKIVVTLLVLPFLFFAVACEDLGSSDIIPRTPQDPPPGSPPPPEG